MSTAPLLAVQDLWVGCEQGERRVDVVQGLSLAVEEGRTLGVVGASGSGKSVTALAILGLLPSPPLVVRRGRVLFGGRSLLELGRGELRALRGRELAMVFQEPMTCLNPVMAVGAQITEAIRAHERVSRRVARERAVVLLDEVGLPDPGRCLGSYPHELSGGMRQRVMIAMALACGPRLLIADEPTTALDVTVQAQVLALLRRLASARGMAMLFISHDLRVIAEVADEVLVMQGGRVMEQAPVAQLFHAPQHAYTRRLLELVPRGGHG